jgi:hypothetical protein
MKKILISANKNEGLGKSLYKLYPDATFCSRETGYELTTTSDQLKFAREALEHDIIIICSSLWKFNQTILLDEVYKLLTRHKKMPYIICIGDTTDRVKTGEAFRLNAEKKALRDYCNTLGLSGAWGEDTPKVTYISLGLLSNKQRRYPERKPLDIDLAANYIKWLIDQPEYVSINEISIDPMQNGYWYD